MKEKRIGQVIPARSAAIACLAVCLAGLATSRSVGEQGPRLEGATLIENVRIVTGAGATIEEGSILIEHGFITAVGTVSAVPDGAERIDGRGLTAYPGFIDGQTHAGLKSEEPTAEERRRREDESPDVRDGPQSATVEAYRRSIRPHAQAMELIDGTSEALKDHRKAGFTTAVLAPPAAIMAGHSAVVQLGDRPWRRQTLAAPFALHSALSMQRPRGPGRPRGGPPGDRGYPVTKMGALALFRQTMLDAGWQAELTAWTSRHPEGWRQLPADEDLAALAGARSGLLPVAFTANTENDIHRALNVAREFALRPVIVGAREAWRLTDRLQAEYVPVIVSLHWDEEPRKVQPRPATTQPEGETARTAPLFDKAWQDQPFEPKRAVDERRRLWEEQVDNCIRLQEAGIPFALTTFEHKSPAELFKNLRKAIGRGLREEAAVAALTSHAARILGLEGRIGTIQPGAIANLTILKGGLADEKAKVRWVFIDGRRYEDHLDGDEKKKKKKDGDDDGEEKSEEPDQPATTSPASGAPESESTTSTAPSSTASAPSTSPADDEAAYPQWPVEIEADRKPAFVTGGNVLLRGATLLTITQGRLDETDLLVSGGKIAAIGKGLSAPAGVVEVDLRGYVVCPGIIDAHSHMATDGGLNEGTLSVTPEVKVNDIINHRDTALFRALAGGVTSIHTMHGSANTIGGQCAMLKLRYGESAEQMKFREAARTLKWALGENVSQKHSGPNQGTRFPNSRMGVMATIRRSLDAAKAYAAEHEALQKARQQGLDPRPLRRDLRLEALAEVLSGELWVNCHCYRADEIVQLLAAAEEYGFRIGVLQHVLEGYRVVAEIVRHGCGASTFSDWWAYKLEAYDAVPHNAARMAQGGIVATVNSDSAEVVRHLNVEAAKSIAFGGLDETAALRLITLNAAIQFGVADRVGSLDVGKDADIAVFDGHPLDTYSRCVMTLVDGQARFVHPAFDPASPPPARHGVMTFRAPPAVSQPPASPTGVYALVGATIHPISGPEIPNGVLVMQGSMISAVGPAAEIKAPSDATVIRVDGQHVYPGLIDLPSGLGLREVEMVFETVDTAEIGRFQPDLRAAWAVNPHSELLEVARTCGILSALAIPQGATIAGQASFFCLRGWTEPEMTFDPEVALCMTLPSLPMELPSEERDKQIGDHVREVREIERFFERARSYAARAAGGRGAAASWSDPAAALRGTLGVGAAGLLPSERDARWEAMLPYVRGQKRVMFTAHSYKQIVEALEFARRVEVRPIINGGRDAWKLADRLAADGVPVILHGVTQYPDQPFDTFDAVYRSAAVLDAAGVLFCLGVNDPSNARQIGVEAGMAVSGGLAVDRAERAITLSPAAIVGYDGLLGSLEVNKFANLIVTTGSPCQAATRVLYAFVEGVPVSLESRQTRMDDKFRARPLTRQAPAGALRGPPAMCLPE